MAGPGSKPWNLLGDFRGLPMLHYKHETDLAHYLEALRKAGLSE